jgi:mRNA interferase MazF
MTESSSTEPRRGEIWLADLDPTRGREQAGRRPVLVLSVDAFNAGPADLVIVAPLTTTSRGIRSHIDVHPPEGGVRKPSAVLCEAVRSISKDRLVTSWGRIAGRTMDRIEDCLRILMGL